MSEIQKNNAGVNTDLTPAKRFAIDLKKYEGQISDLLRFSSVQPSEFLAIAKNAINKNPDLLKCDSKSLFGALLTAAELGLPPNTPAQLSHIIPYSKSYKDATGAWQKKLEAQFQIGYQGQLELMYRNERVKVIKSEIVFEKDVFEEDIIKGITHKPHRAADRGKRIAAYCIVFLHGSEVPIYKVLYDYQIEAFKKISKSASYDNSPWANDDKDPEGWMWKKTCIIQVAKEIPKTKAIQKAIEVHNAVETGASFDLTEEGEAVIIENQDLLLEQNASELKEKAQSKGKSATELAAEKLKEKNLPQ